MEKKIDTKKNRTAKTNTLLEEVSKKLKQKGGFSYHLSKVIYEIFANRYITPILITFISVILIPLRISRINTSLTFAQALKDLGVLITLLVGLIIGNGVCVSHRSRWIQQNKLLHESMKGVKHTFLIWYQKLSQFHIQSESFSCDKFVSSFHDYAAFSFFSHHLCHTIHKAIKETYDISDHIVTLWCKASLKNNTGGQGREYIHNIAHKIDEDIEDETEQPDVRYFIDDDIHKKYFIVEIFENNMKDVQALATKNEIESKFHFEDNDKARNLSQYIAIPLLGKQGEVRMVLQITTRSKNVFGKNSQELKKIAETCILPMSKLLLIWLTTNELADTVNKFGFGGAKCQIQLKRIGLTSTAIK